MLLRSSKRFHSGYKAFSQVHFFQELEMTESAANKNYEEAIHKLNELQSNRNDLKNKTVTSTHINSLGLAKLDQVKTYLSRVGITSSELDKLPVLHVSGTKGKGSTCAFCESILRHHGYKTGFFSSPHLVEVRERIRINGIPIPKETFAKHFWETYKYLNEQKESAEDIPFYFQFLFIMAIRIFLEHNVGVAVIEVGIGGQYDPTNIVTNVPVAGITSLGYDHTPILGNTIESISWNKAGIMKMGSKVFTVPQPEKAYDILQERSIEQQCTLTVVENDCHIPTIKKYPPSIRTNINLAIRMAEAWMLSNPQPPNNNCFMDVDVLKYSIENVNWPGRYEIRQDKNIRYYIDGAHTLESIALCLDWYLNDVKGRRGKRALMFNLTGGRSPQEFFKLLVNCQFDTILFVPNVAKASNENEDNINLVLPSGEQLSNCYKYRETWLEMEPIANVHVFSSVQDSVDYLVREGEHVNLLVTGSLHLVGALSSLLNPDLNGSL